MFWSLDPRAFSQPVRDLIATEMVRTEFLLDIRKVKAVDKIQLRLYSDVIIFSRKGHRSLCSLLSGKIIYLFYSTSDPNWNRW